MRAEPLWQKNRPKAYRPLSNSRGCDVVVIGGGITGLSAAYLLKRAGKKVCLLERETLGHVDTGLTTAHLTCVTDLRFAELRKRFGKAGLQSVVAAGNTAIDAIERIARDESIECDFQRAPGFLCEPFEDARRNRKSLERDLSCAREVGQDADIVKQVPYFKCAGIRFPNQAKFHPLKYLKGLAAAFDGDGSHIFNHSEVTEVEDEPLAVVANGHRVHCAYLVIATHVPLAGKAGLIGAALFQTKIYPYTSYVIGASVPKNTVPEACYWDTSDPYYYLRVERMRTHDYVIFGGKDHKTGQADSKSSFVELQAALTRLIPEAKPDRRWSGQVIETADGLPYIGETSKGQFAATGFAGNGMTFGTIAAMMARDAVLGKENPWSGIFSVGRKRLRGSAWRYLSENLDYPYYYVKDRLVGADRKKARSIARGEGKIIVRGDSKVACARDSKGELHSVSPYCTHMGCLVHWNGSEQTWDCPCHGSRFRIDGEVLAGPAEIALRPMGKTKMPAQAKHSKRRSNANKARKKTPKRPDSRAQRKG